MGSSFGSPAIYGTTGLHSNGRLRGEWVSEKRGIGKRRARRGPKWKKELPLGWDVASNTILNPNSAKPLAQAVNPLRVSQISVKRPLRH
jgi:hypothetical protein